MSATRLEQWGIESRKSNASLNDTCGWRSTTSYQIFVRLLYVLNDVILTTEGRKNRIHLFEKRNNNLKEQE